MKIIKMAALLVAFGWLLPLFVAGQKVAAHAKIGEVVVKGKIGNIHPPNQLWIYMGEEKWDTIPLKNGVFEYRKKTLLPAYGAMRINYTPYYPGSKKSPFSDMSLLSAFFEEGTMTVISETDTLSTRRTRIDGSVLHQRYITYFKEEGDIVKEQKKLAAELNQASPEELQSENFMKIHEDKNNWLLLKFDTLITSELKKYPGSYHTLMAYYNYLRVGEPDEQKARRIASLLSKEYQANVQPAILDKYKKVVQD